MQKFFSQFGEVTRLHLARNMKTGKSKHHAFIEFKYPEVADVVATTMNGYVGVAVAVAVGGCGCGTCLTVPSVLFVCCQQYMFEKYLVCHVLEPAKVHPGLFPGNGRTFKVMPWRILDRDRHNKERTNTEQTKRLQNRAARDRKRQEKLKKADIDYEFKVSRGAARRLVC